MSDATLNPWPRGGLPVGVERKNSSVNTDDLVPGLKVALSKLGLIHLHVFGLPLVIISGKDGYHKPGSKHYLGKAVDLCLVDKSLEGAEVFRGLLEFLAEQLNLTVLAPNDLIGFDYSHLETAD